MKSFVLKSCVLVACIVGLAAASSVLAKGKPGGSIGLGGCPRAIQCPAVYDPVVCDFGVVFPNACEAFKACATGCSGGGV